MAINLPLASQDPYVANLDATPTQVDPNTTFDPSQLAVNTPGQAQAQPGAIPIPQQPSLSGDSYVPPTQTGAASTSTQLPFASPSRQSVNPNNPVGRNITDFIPDWKPDTSNQSLIGQNLDSVRQSLLPRAQVASPTGPPPATYDSDFAGNFLSAERNIPGGTPVQAILHGAQSQAGGLTGGFIGGALAGAAIGSFAPVVGTAIGGLIGGLIGYYIGQSVQDELGKNLATTQTMNALKVQTDYEQQTNPEWYAVGQIAPALLAFHPNLRALAGAFKLVGSSSRTIAAGDLVGFKNLYWGNKENGPAMNALMMMAFGSGQTFMQYQQQVAAGNVQPVVLAINAIGMGLLSEPNYKWLGRVDPTLRPDVTKALTMVKGDIGVGMREAPPGSSPEVVQMYQAKGDAWDEANRLGVGTPEGRAKLEEVAGFDQRITAAEGAAPVSAETPQATQPDQMVHPRQPERQPLRIIPPTENAPGQPERIAEFAKMADSPEKLLELVRQNLVTPAEADKVAVTNGFKDWQPVESPATGRNAMLRGKPQPAAPAVPAPEAATAPEPEPTSEATPGGVAGRIQQAVAGSPAASAAYGALSPIGDVHVVGGAVRNMIAGKPVKDLDMTFSGTEEELNDALSKIGDAEIQKTGDRFPVYRLNVDGDQVEIALHRTENPENQNAFATGKNIPIADDLGRRDFTTNAMAVNLKTGELQDPFNGLKHTQSKSLSLVNPKAFAGDPVRMLRALRFIGDGYHANKTLLESMKENASMLADMPPERIQTELDRIFSSEKPGKALEAMKETGVLDHIFPEHLKTVGFDQRSTHHNQLLWDHIIGVVNKTAELNPDPDVRMAAFLHDISKPDTQVERPGTGGKMSYIGHEDTGAKVAHQILTNFRYSNDRIAKIEFLVKNHMFQQAHVLKHPAGFIHDISKDLMGLPVEDRQPIVAQRIQDLFDIREADQSNHPVNKADIKGMREALDSIGQKPIGRPASNIDGNDLIDLGLKPGPEFSRILKQLDNEVLYDQLPNEQNSLIHRAKEIAGLGGHTLESSRNPTPHEDDPWVETRRAILDYGGIGPSKDWPKDMIPGDLYRVNGKAPDMVATEATIGRASIPPWGDGKSDSEMMKFLHNAWEQHVKFQQQKGAYLPAEAIPDASGHVNQMPRGTGVKTPNPEIRSLATYYTESNGLPRPVETAPVKVDPAKAARLAKFYEEAKSDPTNPEVQASYRAFNDETQKQWELATQAGFKFDPWDKPGQPYKNSAEMRADVLNNHHLFYFKTSQGSPPHELTTEAQNDKFRAVHDLFGHAMNGNEFGPTGEENAWAEHAKMYSPLAQKAMTTETRAQNSTVNFGTHAEHNRANPGNTIYPDQKAILPPNEFLPGQHMQLTHWSDQPRNEINPEHQGASGLSSEIRTSGPNQNPESRFQSYYEQGRQPERFFGPGTAYNVEHKVSGNFKILDLNTPQAAKIRNEAVNQYGVKVPHLFDDAVKQAGYDGYKSNGIVRMFGKRQVDQPGQTEFTAKIGPGQTKSDPIAEANDHPNGGAKGNTLQSEKEPRIVAGASGIDWGKLLQTEKAETQFGPLYRGLIVEGDEAAIHARYRPGTKITLKPQAWTPEPEAAVGWVSFKIHSGQVDVVLEFEPGGKAIDAYDYMTEIGHGHAHVALDFNEHVSGGKFEVVSVKREEHWLENQPQPDPARHEPLRAAGWYGTHGTASPLVVKVRQISTKLESSRNPQGESTGVVFKRIPGEDSNHDIMFNGQRIGSMQKGWLRFGGTQWVAQLKDIAPFGAKTHAELTQKIESLVKRGKINGLQQEAASQPETGSQTGVGGQAVLGPEAGRPGEVGGEDVAGAASPEETNNANDGSFIEPATSTAPNDGINSVEGNNGGAEPGTVPPPNAGSGDLRSNAGDEARSAGATVHAPVAGRDATGRIVSPADAHAASDFTATTYIARNRTSSDSGTTNAEESAKTGATGWSASSDVEQKFIDDVHRIATAMGVDMTKAPQFMGRIRMSQDEHGELFLFQQKPNNRTNQGKAPLKKVALFIPDDPRLVPDNSTGDEWATLTTSNKVVDAIRLHQNGDPQLEYLPTKIIDDATRVALILKGWDKRFFYDRARAFSNSGAVSFDGFSPGAKARWDASQPVFGDGTSVMTNARNVISHFSRMENGVFRNERTGELFDPKIFQDMVDTGIIKQYGHHGLSVDNLIGAAKGFLARTLKIGDYAGAMNGEARAPVDMWRARLAYGKDDTPNVKQYEYEFGRNNFLTRMFAPFEHKGMDGTDTPIMPHHIQSAEWFGYQQHVSESLLRIKQAALATGDPEIIKMANSMRANLESKDLIDVYRDRFGFTDKTKPPMTAFDTLILGNTGYRDKLLKMARVMYTTRYLKGEIGAPARKGGFKDLVDVQEGKDRWRFGQVRDQLAKELAMRHDLAVLYKKFFVDSKITRGSAGARISLERGIGPALERIAATAYAEEFPHELTKLGKEAESILTGLVNVSPSELAANDARYVKSTPWGGKMIPGAMANLGDNLAKPLADLHEKFGLPPGLMGVRMVFDRSPKGGYFARFSSDYPNQIEINAPYFSFLDSIRGQIAPRLLAQLKRPEFKDLKGPALVKVKRAIAGYAAGDDLSMAMNTLAHELGHAIQFRIYGKEMLNWDRGDPDYKILPVAVEMLGHMTPKYMVGLVREGLGNELEALLHAHSSSINEYLGGVTGRSAAIKGETMPLWQAVTNILEHQTEQWSQFMKVPHAEYSQATPEVFRRNVYEPEIAEANARELGKIYQKALKPLADSLAVEAETQRGGRGPNPAIDSGVPSAEESSAGIAAYSRLNEADALQPSSSGWADAKAADQSLAQKLTSGERALGIKASADALRQRLQTESVEGRPRDGRDTATLKALDSAAEELNRGPEVPREWPVTDPRLSIEDPWLQKATAQAAVRIVRAVGEGDRAYALRMIRASGAYDNLDHAVTVVNSARDGVWAPVKYGDKVGFKIGNRFYKGTPGDHVANWADGFHDAIHTVVDRVSDRALVGEPAARGIGAIHPDDLSASFANEYRPVAPDARTGAVSITNKQGEQLPVPTMAPHHFLLSENANRATSALPAGAAANMVTGHFEHVQESIELSQDLAQNALFDPPGVLDIAKGLADAGQGGLPLTPGDDTTGGANNGEEPPIGGGGRPPKGQTPDERKEELRKNQIANSGVVLRGYVQALRDSLKIVDPSHLRVTTGVNDLTTQILKTFSTQNMFQDHRAWVVWASGEMRALAKAYGNVGKDITDLIAGMEAKFPGANERIRNVQHADGQKARQDLLKGMSDEEAALANLLHGYWKVTGDVLLRAGITKSAIENYFPLMVEKPGKGDVTAAHGYSQSSDHAIARLKNEDGSFKHVSPEDLQAFVDDLKDAKGNSLGWKVRTGVGDVFMRQGMGVTRALTTKHTIDQLIKSEVQIGRTKGEMASPILTHDAYSKNPLVTDPINRGKYVRAATVNGPWRSALTYTNIFRHSGDHPIQEDYWVHKSLVDVMERDTAPRANVYSTEVPEPGQSLGDRYRSAFQEENPLDRVAKTIGITNQLWKTWQFFLTPMHEFSLIGNLTTHAGFNPMRVGRFLSMGHKIVNDPTFRSRFYELIRAGAPNDPPELAGFQAKLPGYKAFHDLIWKTTMYNGTFGLADHIATQELNARAARGDEITAQTRTEADRIGMEAAKKAMGSMNNMDLSKNWSMWGNVAFLANRWTTGQLRSVEEAGFGGVHGRFGKMTGAIPLQGHDTASTKWVQDRTIAMSRQLLLGGMIRLAIVGTVTSMAASAILNQGVASSPFDNYQKDPARTFDIYAGRDPVTGKDKWYRMPFYLFQREMVDWVLSAVKAHNEGKDWVDKNNLGDSILAAPFVKFAGKLDPITKLGFESATGVELAGWMKGFTNSQIDSDQYIKNLNASLQMQGFPDYGSTENRLLNAIRSISPSLNFPINLPAPTKDWGQIMGALGLGVGPLEFGTGDTGSSIAPFLGSTQIAGIKYSPGIDGKIQPAWQIQQYYDKQTQLGQQILKIAATLGTGTAAEEKDKLVQMEDLRQQAQYTPTQLTNLILHGDIPSLPTGEKGILASHPSSTSQGEAPTPTTLSGVELNAEQEKAYQSVTFQRESQAILQAASSPGWAALDRTEASAEIATLKAFADRITRQQFEVALGIKHGNVVSGDQATTMLADFGLIKRQTQDALSQTTNYVAAKPQDQQKMLADRISASENAVWEKYYGTTNVMKGASDTTLASYVALQGGLRDETRALIENLPSYSRSLDPAAQIQQMNMALSFADNLVNQAIQGKKPSAFTGPLTENQLVVAVRNGVVLQDAALKQLHASFIYQEAPQPDQLLLDSKYVTLAHNIALYDTRMGIQEGGFGDNSTFNSILATTLAADEGYQTLIEQYFGTGGRVVLKQREAELADLKARFRQEYNVRPQDLAHYDAIINTWYKQMNPDYASFLYYRTQWEKYDALGQAYRATVQSNLGFEDSNPLALAAPAP